MRRSTLSLVLLSGLATLSASPFPATAADTAPPSAAPTTQPDPAADRLTFLTLQLSSIEASLNAVNLALRAAGYKVVLASEKADQAAMGNELMDRKGGAPIAWDKFYGKTAKEFAPRDAFGIPHNYDRPSQFDYLYHANNDQIAKANSDVGALGKKIDILLARRRQLDTEQSTLWATIAWESIQNHDIPLNPLYRFQLKATAATPAADARRDVLRPAIVFLRTIDKTVGDDLDSLHTNQDQTLTDLADRTEAAYAAAKEPFANAMLSADVSPDDLKTSKDLLAHMKHLAELSKNITEAYHLALDGDAAGDDNRKLTFRAQLQFALLDYSTAATDLDYQLNRLANTWGLQGERGVPNPDRLPADIIKPTTENIANIGIPNKGSPAQGNDSQARTVDLLKLVDPAKDAIKDVWAVDRGEIVCGPNKGVAPIPATTTGAYLLQVKFIRTDGQNDVDIFFPAGKAIAKLGLSNIWKKKRASGFESIRGTTAVDNETSRPDIVITNNQEYTVDLHVVPSDTRVKISASLDGHMILTWSGAQSDLSLFPSWSLPANHAFGFGTTHSTVRFTAANIAMLSGELKTGQ